MAYEIPEVGTEVDVCMKNPLMPTARFKGMPDSYWYRGQILQSLKWMTDDMFCLSSGDPQSPIRILDKDRVLDLRPVDGSAAMQVAVEAKPNIQIWQIEGSKGTVYNVTLNDGKWSCDCPASSFRRGTICKHIKQAQAEQ